MARNNKMAKMNGITPDMDVPLPFIETMSDGSMKVNEDVAYVLSQAKDPVGIISIVGKYRTGKSYIMNRFYQSNQGFNLGPTIQSTTKGIWIWARPHPLDPKRTLILLDTEGLHDVEKGDETHDMKLFALALLLSNCLVYNAVGTLDDVIIQQLHLVTELTEHIKTRENADEDGNHFNKYFPSFFLLLRDFFLDLKLEGKDCTPEEYMENALKLKAGRGKKINEYNEPRECIRQFFPRRKCYTLCKPVEDDAKLRQLDSVPESEIKEEFLIKAKQATDAILLEAKPFEVDGNPINGPRFMELARTYVQCMNEGAIPCISNAVEMLKNNECNKALAEALKVFEQYMVDNLKGKMPLEDEHLNKIQKVARDAAVEHYSAGALFDEEGEFMKKLADELERRYQEYIHENRKTSKEKCHKVLMECFKFVDGNHKSGQYIGKGGFDKYKKDKDHAVQQYMKAPHKGPMADNILNIFLENRQSEEEAIINADKALSKKEKELAKQEELRKREEEKARAAEAEQQRLMKDFLRQQSEHQEMILTMQSDFQERQNKMMEEHTQDMKEKEREYNRLMSEGLDKQAEQHKTLMEDMREDRKRLEQQHEQQLEQLQTYKQQHAELMDEMKSQRELSSKQIDAMQQQIKGLQQRPSGGRRCVVM